MNKTATETHRTHCCVLHGCKYSTRNCPVVKRKCKQESACEYCEAEGVEGVPDPDAPNYDLLKMTERQLRDEVVRLRDTHDVRTVSRKFLAQLADDIAFLLGCLSPEVKEDMEEDERGKLEFVEANAKHLRTLIDHKEAGE